MHLTPEECRAARLSLNLTVRGLAYLAGVSATTIVNVEHRKTAPHLLTQRTVKWALKEAGYEPDGERNPESDQPVVTEPQADFC